MLLCLNNDIITKTAEVSCDNLYNNIIGRHPTDKQIKRSVLLGQEISNQEVDFDSILMKY